MIARVQYIGAALLSLAMLLAAGSARAGVIQAPWNLAVVLENSAQLSWQLGGEEGRRALRRSLQMALRSLPLRIRAGLWLADSGGVRLLVPPAPAARIKGAELNLPAPKSGAPDLDGALEQATAWLQRQGKGSLILIAANPPHSWSPPRPHDPGPDGIFCHVLALVNGPAASALGDLAAKGGGTMRVMEKTASLGSLLSQAVLAAISPARLHLITSDDANQAKEVLLRLQPQGGGLGEQMALSNRQVQLPAGAYTLVWPDEAGLGQGPLPQKAVVQEGGVSTLYAGGAGELQVSSRLYDGKPLGWRLSVSRVSDGALISPPRPAPFELKLAAGRYVVRATNKPRAWNVLIRPGDKVEVWAGPRAAIKVNLPGPQGEARARFWMISLLSGRGEGSGHTGNRIMLLPGSYRLELDLPKGLQRRVELKPGQEMELTLEPVGELMVLKGAKSAAVRYQVLSQEGGVLALGVSQRPMTLLPGDYRLKILPEGRTLDFAIEPGKRLEIDPAMPGI